jgi:transcriptional regulator with XRE-family HTH domain
MEAAVVNSQQERLNMKKLDFCLYLKSLRLKSGLTQSDVAEALNYTNSQFVSNWERGKCLPAVASFTVLAKLYNVPMKTLFDRYMKALRVDLWKKASGS